jgi:hypothetical protein
VRLEPHDDDWLRNEAQATGRPVEEVLAMEGKRLLEVGKKLVMDEVDNVARFGMLLGLIDLRLSAGLDEVLATGSGRGKPYGRTREPTPESEEEEQAFGPKYCPKCHNPSGDYEVIPEGPNKVQVVCTRDWCQHTVTYAREEDINPEDPWRVLPRPAVPVPVPEPLPLPLPVPIPVPAALPIPIPVLPEPKPVVLTLDDRIYFYLLSISPAKKTARQIAVALFDDDKRKSEINKTIFATKKKHPFKEEKAADGTMLYWV